VLVYVHTLWGVVGIGVVCALAWVCLCVRLWVLALGVCLWCGSGCERGVGVSRCGDVRCADVFVCGCQGVSDERAVGSHGAVYLAWGVMWLVWCCGLQEEGPLVLCSQAMSGRGVACRRVSADMWFWACGQGVLQSVGVSGGGVGEAKGARSARV
jgi:hypothetical protein